MKFNWLANLFTSSAPSDRRETYIGEYKWTPSTAIGKKKCLYRYINFQIRRTAEYICIIPAKKVIEMTDKETCFQSDLLLHWWLRSNSGPSSSAVLEFKLILTAAMHSVDRASIFSWLERLGHQRKADTAAPDVISPSWFGSATTTTSNMQTFCFMIITSIPFNRSHPMLLNTVIKRCKLKPILLTWTSVVWLRSVYIARNRRSCYYQFICMTRLHIFEMGIWSFSKPSPIQTNDSY